MLHDKGRLHAERGAFFDDEWLLFESLDRSWSSQVDGDVWSTFDFEGKRLDNAATMVIGVDCNRRRRGNAEGGFPTVEGFVISVYGSLSEA